MQDNGGKKDREEKVIKDLLESGWSRVMVGTTTVYQKPAPVQEREGSDNKKTSRKDRRGTK